MRCYFCNEPTEEGAYRCDSCGRRPTPPEGAPNLDTGVVMRGRTAAAFFAIGTGLLGIHKFYLGYNTQGFLLIVTSFVCLALSAIFPYASIGTAVIFLVTITEGVLYLLQSDDQFYKTYVENRRPWF